MCVFFASGLQILGFDVSDRDGITDTALVGAIRTPWNITGLVPCWWVFVGLRRLVQGPGKYKKTSRSGNIIILLLASTIYDATPDASQDLRVRALNPLRIKIIRSPAASGLAAEDFG